MNIPSLTFRDLQYLIALDTHRNFTRAAEVCHVSQPALSTQIKRIEGHFGLNIFERINNNVFPTLEGKKIIEITRSVYQVAQQFHEVSKSCDSYLETELTIGIITSLAPYYPSLFIPELKKRYPLLKIRLVEGHTERLVSELKDGLLDVLICSTLSENKSLVAEPIFADPFVLCVSKQHAFSKKDIVDVSELDIQDMYFLKEGNCLRDSIIDLCPRNKRGKINSEEIHSIEILKNIVAFNYGYCLLPSMACSLPKGFQSLLCLKKISSTSGQPSFPIQFVYRMGTQREADFKALYKVLKDASLFF